MFADLGHFSYTAIQVSLSSLALKLKLPFSVYS